MVAEPVGHEPARVLVLGASGGLGGALRDEIRRRHPRAEIVGLSRSAGDFDLLDEASVAAAARALGHAPLDWVVNASGVLAVDDAGPEKSLAAIDPARMLRLFAIDAVGPALCCKHFGPLLARDTPTVFAHLSARVGSIGDNRLGGWIGYRSAKAALNQIVRTSAIELARRHRGLAMVALHPGTVETALSRPFLGQRPRQSPQQAAARLVDVIESLTPQDNGAFLAWDGSRIPW